MKTKSLIEFLRRRALLQIVAGAAATLSAVPLLAQEGPLTLLVAFPAGGGVDRAARVLAEKLTVELGRTVVVDNKPGAGGQIAVTALKRAATDGSVLLVTNSHPLVTIPHVLRNPGYDVAKDIRPVANFVTFETVLVSTNEVRSYKDLRAWSKRINRQVNIGVPAPASTVEFMAKSIGRDLGVISQTIPYKGMAPLVQDLLGKQMELGMITTTEAVSYGTSGKLNMLAVTQSTPFARGVPTFSELGIKGIIDLSDFIGVFASSAVAEPTLRRYAAAIQRIGAMPDVIEKAKAQGQTIDTTAGAAFADRVQRSSRLNGEVIRLSGYKPE